MNGDHILDGKDVKAIGNNAPLIEYGFYLGAEWKGVALSMQWAGLGKAQTTNKVMPFTFNAQILMDRLLWNILTVGHRKIQMQDIRDYRQVAIVIMKELLLSGYRTQVICA